MRKKLVAGNWKMNASRAQVAKLLPNLVQAQGLSCQLLICPPFPYLPLVGEYLKDSGWQLGAQDCASTSDGAYTGEVSAAMLADLGARFVLLGHSERRLYQQESNALILAKLQQVLEQGLVAVFCIGETLEQRQSGQTEAVILEQLTEVLSGLTPEQLRKLVIAYEPVWAIGTGQTASPEQAQAVHAFIRQWLRQQDALAADEVQIIYGGSVKADNAASLFAMPDIDGGLVGGASLDADQFLAIAQAAS
ncbi:triose-phosphate isomerase [Marinospirillum sp.]|uniref:triose-phosphate isomerase n=1 Tax=Marinospirillum sp. TaxID=2183934 RepID=UPI003A8B1C72